MENTVRYSDDVHKSAEFVDMLEVTVQTALSARGRRTLLRYAVGNHDSIPIPLLFILSTQRAHTRHLLWQGEDP